MSNVSDRSIRSLAGAAFGLLALLFVVGCVLAAIGFARIQSLQSDLTLLRRELLPLKERLALFEHAEKQRRDLEQEQAQDKAVTNKAQSADELRTEPAALSLTREEIQLVKDYIKPAPAAGAPAINVGDEVAGSMIPLPSPLMEKILKLQGARFTTRNGAIIIIKKGSRQADAVLAPN